MKGKDADAAVGIRVGPGVRSGGIVDGQQLKHPLASDRHEVDHPQEIAEVAHAEALSAAQREHRYQRSGHSFVAKLEESLLQTIHRHFSFLQFGQVDKAVHARLPKRISVALIAQSHEFELDSVS